MRSVEDARNVAKKLRKALKCVRERSERKGPEDSPRRAPDEPEDLGGETDVPSVTQSYQEGPRSVRNEHVDGTKAPSRDTGPGGRLEVQGSSKDVEGNPDCAKVVEDAVYDGKRPKSVRNERDVDTKALRRVRGPGGHLVEEVRLGDIEDDRERQSDGDGDEMDGIRLGMDAATSGASGESRRLDTRPLAETDSSQHERRERGTAHVPRPSTPPTIDHRHPTDHPNPPRRRGRIKMKPRQVSQT